MFRGPGPFSAELQQQQQQMVAQSSTHKDGTSVNDHVAGGGRQPMAPLLPA